MIDILPRVFAGLSRVSVGFGPVLMVMTQMVMTLMLMTASTAALAAVPGLLDKDAPDFVLKGLDGRNLRLSEFRGQVVVLNFWARWAGDSRKEMPALDRINTTYARAGVVVLGISVDDDERRAGEFAVSMHVSYPILFDIRETVGRDYSVQKMPLTILVDRAGVVRYQKLGFKRGDEGAYVDQIRELLRD